MLLGFFVLTGGMGMFAWRENCLQVKKYCTLLKVTTRIRYLKSVWRLISSGIPVILGKIFYEKKALIYKCV